MNASDIIIGKEYLYLGKPVKVNEIVGDIASIETEFSTCEVSELKEWPVRNDQQEPTRKRLHSQTLDIYGPNDNPQTEKALRLMERASGAIMKAACGLRVCPYINDDQRLNRAMQYLNAVREIIDEHGPDEQWFRDYFELTGEHMVLTDEGWTFASDNTGEHAVEVLDEVNAPSTAPM